MAATTLALQPGLTASLPFPADTAAMFADHKGEHRKGIEKRQRKLAAKVACVGRFLQPNERVLFVTTACSPFSALEQLTTGAVIFYLKRAMLVVTDKRILQVLTTTGYKYRDSIAEIRYTDIASMTMRFGSLRLKYRNGKKERFLAIGRQERRRFKDLAKSKTFDSKSTGPGMRRHLCPRCTEPLDTDQFNCDSCNLQFKSRAEGRRRALIIPGGGYFYTGHWFLGLGDALAEFLLLVFLVLALVSGGEGSGSTVTVIAVLLIIEKAISVYHTDHFIKEFIPAEKVDPLRR